MKVRVIKKEDWAKTELETNCLYLREDRWNDYNFYTAFDAYYCTSDTKAPLLGWIKIGKKGMKTDEKIIDLIPECFDSLGDEYFSLANSRDYYANVKDLDQDVRKDIHTTLRDMAFDLKIFESVLSEDVVKKSLMRDISKLTVVDQFHRIARGGALLTDYNFSYTLPNPNSSGECPTLEFKVTPNSTPPSNVHVLIGRNGIGKTTLLKNLIKSIYSEDGSYGKFTYPSGYEGCRFANVVYVAFSPFDSFSADDLNRLTEQSSEIGMPYSYVGLKSPLKSSKNESSEDLGHVINRAITENFKTMYAECCKYSHTKELFKDAVKTLESDPVFNSLNISDTLPDKISDDEAANKVASEAAKDLFSSLSSGHKVVLLTLLGCVVKTVEKSIVIIDEPENHLHPPLLSALIRALSDLLIDRNGVAVIATHSPVVLQEVPRKCVWVLRKPGDDLIAERPSVETFGANIGTLTNEVFGLETYNAGFYKMLNIVAEEFNDFQEAVNSFGNELGNEASIILRSLMFFNASDA